MTWQRDGSTRTQPLLSPTKSPLRAVSLGAGDRVQRIYSDGIGKIGVACKRLTIRHDTSTPQRPQTKGLAESAVKTVTKGTRAGFISERTITERTITWSVAAGVTPFLQLAERYGRYFQDWIVHPVWREGHAQARYRQRREPAPEVRQTNESRTMHGLRHAFWRQVVGRFSS